jgi:hypothetical protein
MDQPGALELAEDRHHAAGAVHVFHVVGLDRRRDLRQVRHAAAHAIDVLHREVDAGLVRRRQQVQHGVGRAAHGDVERDGVLEGIEAGDRARQHTGVAIVVVAARVPHDQRPAARNKFLRSAWVASSEPLPGKRQPERLGQAVHRVGGEHARAGAAGRAGRAFQLVDLACR